MSEANAKSSFLNGALDPRPLPAYLKSLVGREVKIQEKTLEVRGKEYKTHEIAEDDTVYQEIKKLVKSEFGEAAVGKPIPPSILIGVPWLILPADLNLSRMVIHLEQKDGRLYIKDECKFG